MSDLSDSSVHTSIRYGTSAGKCNLTSAPNYTDAGYVADYTDKTEHNYDKKVIPPTCTEMGYTIFTCDCGDSYKGDYTDKIAHSYIADVTEPTCTASGYTVYTCENCGKTYTAGYKDMLGHKPSDWIIDEPATIEHAGEKHIECLTCGEVLSRAAIPQLVEKDRTDEDSNSKVGGFSILVTNANGTPIFDSGISIDINDNVTVKLPSGRLLDYEDQTVITAINTESQQPKSDLQIFVYDENNNAATGKTDENGQLKLPNNKTSTGDNSGTVGKDDEDIKNTFVVKVTDKMNAVIPNCDVYIGESNNIVVNLPDETNIDYANCITVTVTDKDGKITLTLPSGTDLTGDNYYTIKATDNKGNAKADVSIILNDRKNNSATGTTDKGGMLILPGTTHKAYIMGYPDGSFRPDGDMSRAEAAAIFARLIADKKNESVKGTPLFNEIKSVSNTTKYNDLSNSYWAIKNISYATNEKWLNGYSDGSFRPDIIVTRAEVVIIINRATNRNADKEFINKNLTVLNRFTDVKNNSHWAAYDIFEISNDHIGISNDSDEIWNK